MQEDNGYKYRACNWSKEAEQKQLLYRISQEAFWAGYHGEQANLCLYKTRIARLTWVKGWLLGRNTRTYEDLYQLLSPYFYF